MQGQTKVYKYPNATVRVHIPDLAPEEREKRQNALKKSVEMLMREVLINESKGIDT